MCVRYPSMYVVCTCCDFVTQSYMCMYMHIPAVGIS